MKKIALYGGSFNPPHVSHVMTVAYVLSTSEVDELWWMPCFSHAFAKALAPFEHRCEMCRLASLPFSERVAVTEVESELGTKSWTIDTIEHLIRTRPSDRFTLVVGADILLETHLWKRFDDLERLVDFIVLGREGVSVPDHPGFDVVLPKVSSTEVRRRLRAGDIAGCRSLVPEPVLDYALEQGLY